MTYLLLVLLVSLSTAQLWPLDFGDYTLNQPQDDMWLPPGRYPVDIDPATDYSDAFIEFTFKSVYPAHSCEYQVWADDAKVFTGSFRNALPTPIPALRGSFPLGTQEISVWTSGCYLNRLALPFTLGANGDSLYLYDQSIPTTVDIWGPLTAQTGPLSYGVASLATNTTEAQQYAIQFYSSQSGTGSFSSQTSPISGSEDGWINSLGAQTFLPISWVDLAPFNETDAAWVLEASYYTKQAGCAMYFVTCNTSAIDCNEVSDYLNGPALAVNIGQNLQQNSENSRMYSYASGPQKLAEATPLTVGTYYMQYDEQSWPSEYAPNVIWGYVGGCTTLYPPYVKFWDLNQQSDPNHAVIDLRTLSSPASSAGDCTARTAYSNPNTSYYSAITAGGIGGNIGDWISGSLFAFIQTPIGGGTIPPASGWFQCPNDDSGQLSNPVVASCSELSEVASNNGVVSTNAITVTIDLPGGGFMAVPNFDEGLKVLGAGPCGVPGPSGLDNVYLSQMSWFDVVYDGTVSGTVAQAAIKNNFQGRAAALGTYETFFINTATTDGADLVFRSKPGFSMDLWPFVFIHGLRPSSGNDTGCDASLCENGGVCSGTNAQVCLNPASQGGAPAQSEDFAKIVTEGTWTGLWYGDLNEIPVPYCTPDTCWNGGVCVENPARTWNAELYGTGGADDATLCDCSAVTRETALNLTDGSSTGNYWGEKCQYAPPCDATPCFNNGTCVNEGGSIYSCDCTGTSAPYSNKPYAGARCEIDTTTPCDLSPCLNSGTCTDTPGTPGGFTCVCTGGWSGHSCGIPPVDNCLLAGAVDVCGEFGRCVASFNPTGVSATAPYTQCVCLYGYSGATCNTPPAACSVDYTDAWQKRDVSQRQFSAEYCLNGGSCIGVGDSAGTSATVACLCLDPWVGSRCQWNSTIFAGSSSLAASFVTLLMLVFVAVF